MAGNKSLHDANKAKKDEFYTQLDDISNELRHYCQHFKGKTVFCNCDDPYESNFFKFFAMKFNAWGLKKLISTSWGGSQVVQTELLLYPEKEQATNENKEKKHIAYKIEITEIPDMNGDGAVDDLDVKMLLETYKPELLKGDGDSSNKGDFRSSECRALLEEADIVVTNPPFSLFREYVAQLVKYNKKFLIIGNLNAVTYKEIFPLIKENKMWLGITRQGSGQMWFKVPDSFPIKTGQKIENNIRYQTIGNSCWFTNLDHKKLHEPLDLYKKYTPEEYPKYDNYDAIEVSKTTDIPMDYDGVIGVPITFLGKYCPEQFEILGLDRYTIPKEALVGGRAAVNGKSCYARILIKKT